MVIELSAQYPALQLKMIWGPLMGRELVQLPACASLAWELESINCTANASFRQAFCKYRLTANTALGLQGLQKRMQSMGVGTIPQNTKQARTKWLTSSPVVPVQMRRIRAVLSDQADILAAAQDTLARVELHTVSL